jgi:hypothetical protein
MARRAKARCARCVVCPEISVGIAATEAVALQSLFIPYENSAGYRSGSRRNLENF